ncbi:MAG: chemotaxis protein CheA [Gammaproteobacteria bacterium]|nr:MAG: chemotaxis protein CheA [Gammaproteobacteria bacterium]
MGVDLSQFHETFFEEASEGLDDMESSLLNLKLDGDYVEDVNTIFRGAHSIKGGSATFGFSDVAEFTHVMETLMDQVRSGERKPTQEDIDLFLLSVDCVRDMLFAHRDSVDVDRDKVADMQSRLEAALHDSTVTQQGGKSSDDTITEDEFEALLDELHGNGKAPSAKNPPATVGYEEISDEEFDSLLDDLHGAGKGPTSMLTQAVPVSGWHISFRPCPEMLKSGNDPKRIIRELAAMGELQVQVDTSGLPPFSDMNPEECYLAWDMELRTQTGRDDVEEVFAWVDDSCDIQINALEPGQAEDACAVSAESSQAKEDETPLIKPVDGEPMKTDNKSSKPAAVRTGPTAQNTGGDNKPATETSGTQRSSGGSETTSIRVKIEKVDELINMVGELVITQSMLSRFGEDFDIKDLPMMRDGLAELERNTRELQESAMRIRMLPISFAFNRFPRLVRDLSNKLGKKIELKLTGEQTELDKTVMEKIGDPLVHLVRNALDHGIEAPEVRQAAGKPETGILQLNAYHEGGNIVIEISDDGAGLNTQKILTKAREQGIVTDESALSEQEICDLIFHPGLSTAGEVSDVSGRGVGMDVVRKNIRDLSGNVEIYSKTGEGSTITIRLPLTLAILDGQIIRVGNETYIIPLVSIIETIQVDKQSVNAVAGNTEVFSLREQYIQIIRLYDVFGIDPDKTDLSEGLLVVVEGDNQKVGLFVDELYGQQQVVIKSLKSNYKAVEGISGATILGDGTVALIIDTPGLIKLAHDRGITSHTQFGQGAAA